MAHDGNIWTYIISKSRPCERNKNKCTKCSKNYILWLQSCNSAIFTTAIKGAHKETQVPFKHMLNLRFSSGCSKKLGSLFDITQIVFAQSHL